MSAFGYVSTGFEEENNQLTYVPQTNNYRAYLEYAAKLYSEGLLDNNTFNMDDRALAAKGELVGCFDGAAAYLVVGEKSDEKYDAVPAITSNINNEQMWLGFNTVTPSAISINTPYCSRTC